MSLAVVGQSTREGSLIQKEDFSSWAEKFVSELGHIPPLVDWPSFGFPYHPSTFSKYLKDRYPAAVSNRLKLFLNDIYTEGYFFLKRTSPDGRIFTIKQNLAEFVRYIEDFKTLSYRVPYAVEYKTESRKRPYTYNLMRQESLQKVLGLSSYAEILSYLGYSAISASNQHYHDKLSIFGIPYISEDVLNLDGKQYRVDYCLTLPDGHVWLEIDGSSHYSPASPYHTNPATRKGSTAMESFEKKVERDSVINNYFKENSLPLIRVSHFHFATLTKLDLERLIEKAREVGYVKTYKVYKKETPQEMATLILEGKTVREIGESLGLSYETANSYINRHNLRSLYQETKPLRESLNVSAV